MATPRRWRNGFSTLPSSALSAASGSAGQWPGSAPATQATSLRNNCTTCGDRGGAVCAGGDAGEQSAELVGHPTHLMPCTVGRARLKQQAGTQARGEKRSSATAHLVVEPRQPGGKGRARGVGIPQGLQRRQPCCAVESLHGVAAALHRLKHACQLACLLACQAENQAEAPAGVDARKGNRALLAARLQLYTSVPSTGKALRPSSLHFSVEGQTSLARTAYAYQIEPTLLLLKGGGQRSLHHGSKPLLQPGQPVTPAKERWRHRVHTASLVKFGARCRTPRL